MSHDCTFDSLRSMVDAMDIPSPFTIESLSDRIATSRGRPLYLHPMAFPADAATSGALVSTTDADHVFYERHTSTFHQNHIVLHELGHLLAGHPGVNAPATVPASLLPDLDHDFVRRYLQRSCLHDSAEQDAEMFAILVMERVRRATRANRSAERCGLLTRMNSSFGTHRRA